MGRVETESGGTRRRTGGELKGKEANGVGSQQSCTVSEHGLSSITTANAYTSAAGSRLKSHPADLIGLVRFGGRTNLVSALVPSHSVFTLTGFFRGSEIVRVWLLPPFLF